MIRVVEYVNSKNEKVVMRLYHMPKKEADLACAFIKKHGKEYNSFDTDVLVGTVLEPTFKPKGEIYEVYNYLMSKRIDLVGYKDKEIHVLEVKLRGGFSLLGQALLYRDLYKQKYNPDLEVRGGCVCVSIDVDVKHFLEQSGILIYILDECDYLL